MGEEGSRTPTLAQTARNLARILRGGLPWAGLLVSAFFAYLAVRHVQFDDVWHGLRTSNYWWLVPSFLMLAVTVFVRALRWRFLFSRETRPGTKPVLLALLIGYFFNNVLPARAGEAARIVVLTRRGGTSGAETAATVVIERVLDVVFLLALLFVTLPWLPEVTWLRPAAVLAVAVATGLAIAIVLLALFEERPLRFALRPLARLPFLSRERVELIATNFARGLVSLRSPRLALGAAFWTALGWLTLAVSTWLLMIGFGIHVSLVGGLFVVVATNLAMILPSSPAAIGVFEAATLVALRPYGISDSQALSYALVLHAMSFIPFVAVGLVLVRGTLVLGRAETAS